MKWSEPKVKIKIQNVLEVSEIFSKNNNWKIALCWHKFEGYTVDIYKWDKKNCDWKYVNTNFEKVPSFVSHEFYCKQRNIEVILHG